MYLSENLLSKNLFRKIRCRKPCCRKNILDPFLLPFRYTFSSPTEWKTILEELGGQFDLNSLSLRTRGLNFSKWIVLEIECRGLSGMTPGASVRSQDCVSHWSLMIYGIGGVPIKRFKTYLSNRKQYVCIGSSSPKFSTMNIPVSQGSIFGPVIFLLYINKPPKLYYYGCSPLCRRFDFHFFTCFQRFSTVPNRWTAFSC